MKHRLTILKSLVCGAALMAIPALLSSCSDANEPEAREPEVIGPSQQDPAAYAAYTASLRAWKATPHHLTIGILDNAPEVSTSERDFLRSLPDSLDMVAMRNSAGLTGFDRADMAQVRADYATRVLYWLDATAPAESWDAAAKAVASGSFDGIVLSANTAPEPSAVATLVAATTGKTLILAGAPSLIDASQRDAFDYFLVDISSAKDNYDIELAVRLAMLSADASRLILATVPGLSLTDTSGVTRGSLAAAAITAKGFSPTLAGIAIDGIGADYYDPDIIYKRTRGAIQILNPAAK